MARRSSTTRSALPSTSCRSTSLCGGVARLLQVLKNWVSASPRWLFSTEPKMVSTLPRARSMLSYWVSMEPWYRCRSMRNWSVWRRMSITCVPLPSTP